MEAFTLKGLIAALGIILTIINFKKSQTKSEKKYKVEILTAFCCLHNIYMLDFHNSSAIFHLWPCTP